MAALAVQPFLYGALLIVMAALLLIPLLAPPGQQFGRGVQRFLKVQILAVPFLLFAGWILSGVEANPGNQTLILRAAGLLALGFALLLAIFPFHSWVPMLSGESHPYVFGFMVFFLPSLSLVFALGFFDRYAWLRESTFAHPVLLSAGGLMVALGGLWAAREKTPRRLLGFCAMLCTGFALQAVGLSTGTGPQVFFALLLPQAFAIWIWATGLGILESEAGPFENLTGLRGSLSTHPLVIATILVAVFSLAGLPVLASFPGRIAALDNIATFSPWAAALSLIGSIGLLTAGGQLLVGLLPLSDASPRGWVEEAASAEEPNKSSDLNNPYVWVFVAMASVGFLGFGLLPSVFLSAVPHLAAMFSQLAP